MDLNIDISRLRALDVETPKIVPGRSAPPIVVGSMAEVMPDGTVRGELIGDRRAVARAARAYLAAGYTIVNAQTAFDMCCVVEEDPSLLPAIFQAYREGRIIDISIAHALDAIFGGHMSKDGAAIDPRTGMPLRNPSTGEVTNRYALATVLDLVTGRTDAKDAAAWRMSYELLRDVPFHLWPSDARTYPVDDTCNALAAFLGQMRGWPRGRMEPGECGPARNMRDLTAQCEVSFCLALGAAHSLRTDPERVEALAVKVEELHRRAVARFQKSGWRRPDVDPETGKPDPKAGTENQIEVKRSVALAYGVTGKCPRCAGSGRVRPIKQVACRGEKVRGRYKGCPHVGSPAERVVAGGSTPGIWCFTCAGKGTVDKVCDLKTCKASDGGCDGTGLNLKTQPFLPRADKGAIRADRDTLMESGDDELAAYGEDEFEKTRTTFIPYLRSGTRAPLKLVPNVLVASGRLSYEGSPFHQLTRGGGVRETIVAREGMVLGSTDYEAGELCTLSEYCYWILKYSGMRDAINASGKPGILHSELAASVIGISIEEFLRRLKDKDKQCVDFRQASKPINFGTPGGMGSAKLVWTARKKNAGFTLSEYGPSTDDGGRRGYAGIRFCILIDGRDRCGVEKITEWKGRQTYPVCRACVNVVESTLRAAYFRRFPEIKEYFRWVSGRIEADGRVPCLAFNQERGVVEILRWRGGVDFPAGCNNGFQALLADVMKRAYVAMTREGYLGVKEDGSPSPLAGCRFPVIMHDEPISELFAATAHLSGPRVAEIMMEAGRALAPDVVWKAETAIATHLSKSMEPRYDDQKNLILWEPEKKAA
jgi:hypothetical protein